MKNRAILARLGAKTKKKKAPAKEKKADVKGVLAKDPESGEVVHTFDNLEAAGDEGFRVVNIKSSLKTGNKYKGFLWGLIE